MVCSRFLDPILCLVDAKRYNLLTVLDANASQVEIGGAIGHSAFGKYLPDYDFRPYLGMQDIDMEISHQNSIKSLISNSLLNNQTFQQTVKYADIKDFGKIARNYTFVFSLLNDSVVPANNTNSFTKAALMNPYVDSYMFPNSKHVVCDKTIHVSVDHLRAEALANVFAMRFICRP